MKDSDEKLSVTIDGIDPTERLCGLVMQKVRRAEMCRLRVRLSIYTIIAIATIVAFVPVIRLLIQGLSQSGAVQYASLFISDGYYAFTHWQALFMSVTDALPIPAIIFTLILLIVCAASINKLLKYRSVLSTYYQY